MATTENTQNAHEWTLAIESFNSETDLIKWFILSHDEEGRRICGRIIFKGLYFRPKIF